MIDFVNVNQSSVEWQEIPSESQINSKDIFILNNRLEQLDTHDSCTFINKMVTGIQLQHIVMNSITKFHLKIFSNEQIMDCKSEFVKMTQLEDVTNGRDKFKLPKETKAGGIYDGNDIEFKEIPAPISGIGFYTYIIDENTNRHRPYIFSLNYGIFLKSHEKFVSKLGQSLQSEPGFYTRNNIL